MNRQREQRVEWAQKAKREQAKFRALFLSNANGRDVLWRILIDQCRIFEHIKDDEARIRHNIGLELMCMCGILFEGRPRDQLFVEIVKMRPVKQSLLKKLRRKING